MTLLFLDNRTTRRWAHFYRLLFAPLVVFIFLLSSCSPQKQTRQQEAKPISYSVAPQTSRTDIITESIITLNSFAFTIEFADARGNYEALRTSWRLNWQTLRTATGEEKALQVRDRAILHLSPRGTQADRATLVASTIDFEMEMKGAKKDSWVDITPDPASQELYTTIIKDLQNRLRHRGYQFN